MIRGKTVGIVALLWAVICGCGDDKSEDTSGQASGGSGTADPGLGIGEPDSNGFLPGAEVEACAARVTEITVEINGETHQVQQEQGRLSNCCGPFSLQVEGCEVDTDRCYTVVVEEETLILTQGTRGDGGVTWGDPLEIRAVNDPEITDWPETRCSIDDRPYYYWVEVTSHSAIGGDSISLSATINAYVTGSSDCQCP
ncbi:MAG TPA: hypothetical protein VHO25_02775 [Polyangiaceae bacterium]|nr:hypothetical protein [Polyangiaceae bacterium]